MKKLKLNISVLFIILFHLSCTNEVDRANYKHKKVVQDHVKYLFEHASERKNVLNIEFMGTINLNLRKPNYIILHHTGEKEINEALKYLLTSKREVSAHYVVKKNGEIVQMGSDYLRLWHAGESRWGSITDMNSCSLGVELDNDGEEDFPPKQVAALIDLLNFITQKYNIPSYNILAHSDITYRKYDPHTKFPWAHLASKGLGLWYDPTLKEVSADFNSKLHLKAIGYDTRDLNGAIVAFKRHFIPSNDSTRLSPYEKSILSNLATKSTN
ncbi:N-acetylmuramoyl-L-alanine amidase [Daejeonella lutea]|uniref:N-acetylmuramoyl-L-alanine amidase n=1 Tax=Daejeonella lutea TaxID=572036 RepID=A0A1T5B1P9_9SPHI|nr:N-acetylmuramoyl-L-alanine amidase [Daejeonella lutea]SKB41134.1 N-acetylmuramoyl-L-alanine amidase [Daejeonella lutea]